MIKVQESITQHKQHLHDNAFKDVLILALKFTQLNEE